MHSIDDLLAIMKRLRDPVEGCPWDLEQSFSSIVPHTLEEAYEVADAIERGDPVDLCDELGDLLFQVIFYARLGEEGGVFDFGRIVDGICNKLIRRHPHVFGDERIDDAGQQSRAWERHKQAERRRKASTRDVSQLDDISLALPALSRAQKLQRRASAVGFDWHETAPVMDKVREEIAEVEAELRQGGDTERLQDEIGDLLFVCVNLARHAGIDAESSLRQGNRKFERRFRFIEQSLAARGRSLEQATLDEMDALWDQAKQQGL